MFNPPKSTINLQEMENGLREINNIALGRILEEAKKYQAKAENLESILEEKQEAVEKAEEEYARVKIEYDTYTRYWQTMNQLEEDILKIVNDLREKVQKANQ